MQFKKMKNTIAAMPALLVTQKEVAVVIPVAHVTTKERMKEGRTTNLKQSRPLKFSSFILHPSSLLLDVCHNGIGGF
jgi:hypothetical protein